MLLSGKPYLAVTLQQLLDERILVLQFAHPLLEGGVSLIGIGQLKNHITVTLVVFF